MCTLVGYQPVIPSVTFINWSPSIPFYSEGSLCPTYVSVRLLGLSVKYAYRHWTLRNPSWLIDLHSISSYTLLKIICIIVFCQTLDPNHNLVYIYNIYNKYKKGSLISLKKELAWRESFDLFNFFLDISILSIIIFKFIYYNRENKFFVLNIKYNIFYILGRVPLN